MKSRSGLFCTWSARWTPPKNPALLGNRNVTTVVIKGPGDLREPEMRRRGVDAASISDASYSTGGLRHPMSIAALIFSKLNVYGLKPQFPLQLQRISINSSWWPSIWRIRLWQGIWVDWFHIISRDNYPNIVQGDSLRDVGFIFPAP